jgi:hypothetical protein
LIKKVKNVVLVVTTMIWTYTTCKAVQAAADLGSCLTDFEKWLKNLSSILVKIKNLARAPTYPEAGTLTTIT